MPRPPRIHSPGDFYHITARGNDKQAVFHDDEDRERFLEILLEAAELLGFRLVSFCLMTNHIHLLLQMYSRPVGELMHRLLGIYSRWFNKKYGRKGHLFEDRHFSRRCLGDADVLGVIRYIHNNPVDAGLVKGASDWPWSSHPEFLGTNQRSIVDAAFGLSFFGTETRAARLRYLEFIAADEKRKIALSEDGATALLEPAETPSLTGPKKTVREWARLISAETGIPTPIILGESRFPKFVSARRQFIISALHDGHSTAVVARLMACSSVYVASVWRTNRKALKKS